MRLATWTAVGLVALLLCILPPAGAQPVQTVQYEIQLDVADLATPAAPGVPVDLAVRVALKCESGSLPLEDASPAVDLSAEGPEWLTVEFETDPLVMPISRDDCLNGRTAQAETTVRLMVNRLLGGVSSGIEYRADAPWAFGGGDADHVFIEWVFAGQASFAEEVYELGPPAGWHRIPFAIEYRTNGKSSVWANAVQEHGDNVVSFDGTDAVVGPGEGTVWSDYEFMLAPRFRETGGSHLLQVAFSFSFAGAKMNETTQAIRIVWDDPPARFEPAPSNAPLLALAALLVLFKTNRRR